MKKLYSALLVVALTAAMVLPVFAAPSPKAGAKEAAANATINVEGAEVNEVDDYEGIMAVVTNPTHLTNLKVAPEAKVAAAFDLEIDITPGQTVTVPVKVNNAKPGDYAYILHRMENAEKTWEKVGEGQLGSDLTVNMTISSASPFVVMVVDAAQVSAAGVKAPKTGEF